ncbi:MAG: ECF transporter S component, partial [Eubacterium sp.]|nr:ECF transporter S component [Eubacterium sp.]
MSIQKIALTALFAALTCVATMVIRIPVPATGGYLNLGDGFVILCGILLGPAYGFLAAGIGSGLADLLAGYTQYVPGTFLIKG